MRKGARAYFAANLVSQVFSLLRFALLARILGPEQLGLAAMLMLTSSFLQTASDTGSDRFLVQDPGGETPTVQGLVQLTMVIRGALMAAALVIFAGLATMIFDAPQLRPAIMAMAIVPLIGGFAHMDYIRAQREGDFRPESAVILAAETMALVGTLIAATITHDASAVIYGLALRAITLLAVSHITAKRPYRWAFRRAEGARFSAFAWPMMLNGLLLFFGSQGDRVLVANGLGAEVLGHYSAVLLLVFLPTSMAIRMAMGFYLPQLARARGSCESFAGEQDRLGGRILLLAIVMLAGFALAGPIVVPLLYGPSFHQPLAVFALIGAMQMARLMRVWPTVVATSVGRSSIVLYNSIARMVGLPIAFVANLYYPGLATIVLGFMAGEVVAILVALWLLDRMKALKFRREIIRVGTYLWFAAVVYGWTWCIGNGRPVAFFSVAAASLVAIGLLLPERKIAGELIVLGRKRLEVMLKR